MRRKSLVFAIALAVSALPFAPGPVAAQEADGAPSLDYGDLPDVAERYLARTDGLVGPPFGRVFFPLIELPYAEFAARWDSLRVVEQATLTSVLRTDDVPERFARLERARIDARWARGHLMYPYFHWRETGADSLVITAGFRAARDAVDRNDAELLVLEDFRAYVDGLLHEEARRRVREDERYRAGAARWTRAKYDAAVELIDDADVRAHALAGVLLGHLEQLGIEHVDGLLLRLPADLRDTTRLAEVRAAYDEEHAGIPETRLATYKEVDGVELRLHVRRPQNAADSTGAAFVWFHGGSWNGAWYRCPFLCSAALRRGMTVVQVEYRTADGFDATPLDALDDARGAIEWLRRHGTAYGIDPERIVAAGFSSGATLALMTALGERADPGRPDAIVSVGGCADPTEDGWFRQSVGRSRDPHSLSPAHNVSGREPPTLLVHGTADEYCPFDDAAAFARAVQDAGGVVRLEPFADRPHFFLFMSPEDRAAAIAAIDAFLLGLGYPTRAP